MAAVEGDDMNHPDPLASLGAAATDAVRATLADAARLSGKVAIGGALTSARTTETLRASRPTKTLLRNHNK
jgi:hypothetical protein